MQCDVNPDIGSHKSNARGKVARAAGETHLVTWPFRYISRPDNMYHACCEDVRIYRKMSAVRSGTNRAIESEYRRSDARRRLDG